MPLELPNLDDRTYKDLVAEALSLIPTYAPEWTDYNPSDPGITLIEMFAYLTEMLIYRLNLVTDENKYQFLKLINGPNWQPSPGKTLEAEIQATILQLRQCDRAVTKQDFETLTLQASPEVARVRCFPRRNLDTETTPGTIVDQPGHVSLVILPHSQESYPQPTTQLIDKVKTYLEPRLLLTTKLHIVKPKYITISVRITVVLDRDTKTDNEIKEEGEKKTARKILTEILTAIQNFFHPLTGGREGKGWEFGRNIYVSEIYELLDQQPGIDYVIKTKNANNVELDEIILHESDSSSRQIRNRAGKLIGISLQDNELVKLIDVTEQKNNITLITPIQM